jgi:hypothetical protein
MDTDLDINYKPGNMLDIISKTDDQLVKHINEGIDGGGGNLLDRESHTDDKIETVSERKRTLYQRFFSKMEAGSLRGSVFAMSSLALGTGCLALPQKFEQMSFVVALLIILIGAIPAYWSLTLMIKASEKTKTYDYSRLVKENIGRWPALLLDITILIYILGILISYQCISKN